MIGAVDTLTTPRARRAPAILDAIILIVALAVAMAIARAFLATPIPFYAQPKTSQRTAYVATGLASRFLGPTMVGLLVVRLRQPRPSRRRLSRQPGGAACAAATAALGAGGLVALSLTLFRSIPISSRDEQLWPIVEAGVGPAVAAAWVVLLVTGRWRSERSWIDRAGRVCGASSIGLVIFQAFHGWLVPWLPAL